MIKIKPKSNSPFSSTYPATEAMNADVIREADDRGAGSTWRRIMCALSLASTSSGEEKFIFKVFNNSRNEGSLKCTPDDVAKH